MAETRGDSMDDSIRCLSRNDVMVVRIHQSRSMDLVRARHAQSRLHGVSRQVLVSSAIR